MGDKLPSTIAAELVGRGIVSYPLSGIVPLQVISSLSSPISHLNFGIDAAKAGRASMVFGEYY